jgi:signal transduction histidine kinase
MSALNRIGMDSYQTNEVFEGVRTLFGKVDLGPVKVNEIIVEAIHSLNNEFKDHRIETRMELLAALPLVNGHKGQLRAVIFNLVTNALEAMAAITDRSRLLWLSSELRGHDAIVVSVQDTGPGIDPGQVNKLFDAFVTTKSHGTGLGLAICRLIIDHHGGQLSASSDGKSGALFQFVLPIVSADTGTPT